MRKTKEIVYLLDKGYRLYTGEVPDSYYGKFCKHPKKANWFCRPWSERTGKSHYICLGCMRRCTETNPKGWPLFLPISHSRPGSVTFASKYPLTAEEMLRIKKVLRVDEAAWCLNVSVTHVYNMIDEGKLDKLADPPARVTSESVARNLEPEY